MLVSCDPKESLDFDLNNTSSYELVELSSAVVQDRGFSTPGDGDYEQQGDPFFKGGVAENCPSKAGKVKREKRTSSEFSSEVVNSRSSRPKGPPKTLPRLRLQRSMQYSTSEKWA